MVEYLVEEGIEVIFSNNFPQAFVTNYLMEDSARSREKRYIFFTP